MEFKHWREAETRATKLNTEIEAMNTEISAIEVDARNEETSIEKRDELIIDLQSKVEKRNALQIEYDKAIEAQSALKETEERQIGLLNNVTTKKIQEREERKKDMDKSIYETRAYEIAWGKSILTDDKTELRNLINTQDNANAGYLIPTRLSDSIKENVFTGGKLISLCNSIEGKGILEQPYLSSETNPEIHKEKSETEKVEKAIEFAIRSVKTEIIAEWIPVTKKFENNDGGLFFDWLMKKLPQAITKKMEHLILLGAADGSDGLVGILNETNTRFVAEVKSELTFNTANIGVSKLDDGVEDKAVVIMNRDTFFENVLNLQGADGHPIYTIMTDNLNRPSFRFGSYPVIFNSNIKSYANATSEETYMLIGDFNGYTIQYPNGMNPTILRDPYTNKKRNVIEYLSELECGGNILELGHFTRIVK